MANKTLLVVLGLAMIASTAKASSYMDAFEAFVAAPGVGPLLNMILNQLISLVEPMLIGIAAVVAGYAFDNGSFDMGGTAVPMNVAFPLFGAGNKQQLVDALVQYTHKTIIDQLRQLASPYLPMLAVVPGFDPTMELLPFATVPDSVPLIDNIMAVVMGGGA